MGKRKHDPHTCQIEPPGPRGVADALVAAARRVAADVGLRKVIVFADGLDALDTLRALSGDGLEPILALRGGESTRGIHENIGFDVLAVSAARLSRSDQIKAALLTAFSEGLIQPGEKLLALVGLVGQPIDGLIVLQTGASLDLLPLGDSPLLSTDIRPDVFQRLLQMFIALAAEGREGKPVGVLAVLGDIDRVLEHADQMIINPFRGYQPAQRDIMDELLMETFREFAVLDGAFLIRGNGQIETAGAYLRPSARGHVPPAGLGARHATAAAITASADCMALTISESAGTVRIWRCGRMIAELKRPGGASR